MKILIVEDNRRSRDLLKLELNNHGFEADGADNGIKAIEYANNTLPDLVISDISMPEMDGFSLCKKWKTDSKLKDIPFMFYTSTYKRETDRKYAESLGADKFLIKSADTARLIDSINLTLKANVKSADSDNNLFVEKENFYKKYNVDLIRKLEDKKNELNEAKREIAKLNDEMEEKVRLRTAELNRENKELIEFAHCAAHDLSAPARVMNGFASILLEEESDNLSDDGRSHLERIRSASIRMQQLIVSLLHLSKINEEELTRSSVNISALANNILSELESHNHNRDVDVIVQDEMMVEANESLMNIALTNLIQNAWKYTSFRSNATIEIGQKTYHGKPVFFVKDNGVGFDMNNSHKLFDVFTRLTTKNQYEGMGIGLSTVKRIIERHGGEIWAESEGHEKGSVFYFTMGW